MKKKKLKKIVISILSLAIVFLLLFAYYFWYQIFYIEDHCQRVAEQEVGGHLHWSDKMVPPPAWFHESRRALLYIGWYKQLECEHNNKPFIFF